MLEIYIAMFGMGLGPVAGAILFLVEYMKAMRDQKEIETCRWNKFNEENDCNIFDPMGQVDYELVDNVLKYKD